MSEHDQDQLSPELLMLLRAGRPGPQVPKHEYEQLLASLAPFFTPPLGGPGGGAGTPPGQPLPEPGSSAAGQSLVQAIAGSKMAIGIGGLLVGTVVGAAGHAALQTAPDTPVAAVVVASPVASVTVQRVESAAPEVPSAPASIAIVSEPVPSTPRFAAPAPPVASSSKVAATEPPAMRDEQLRAERQLLDIARTAVARGDGAAALAALDRHAAHYPNGRLSEEREALRVQALLLMGRREEAREQAEGFRKNHPDSLMLPGIAPALDDEGNDAGR